MEHLAVATEANVVSQKPSVSLPPLLRLEIEQTPIQRGEIMRGYQAAFFLMRDLLAAWERGDEPADQFTLRVLTYIGYRFNVVSMRRSAFCPKPWIATERKCEKCDGSGGSCGSCDLCSGRGYIGGRADIERAI